MSFQTTSKTKVLNRARRRVSSLFAFGALAATAAIALMPLLGGARPVRAQDYVSPDDSPSSARDNNASRDNASRDNASRDDNGDLRNSGERLDTLPPNAPGLSILAPNRDTIAALLSGQSAPLSLKLNDLKSGWRRVSLNSPSTPQDKPPGYPRPPRGHIDFDREWLDIIGAAPGVYLTRGQTVSSGGDSFLLVYRTRFSPGEMETLFPDRKTPTQEQATRIMTKFLRERPLDLSLVNLKTVNNLSDIRPFDIETQVIALQKLIAGAMKEMEPEAVAASRSNLLQLGLGLFQYSQDNDDTLPPMTSVAAVKKAIMPYLKDAALFVQPGANAPYQPNPILSRKKLAHIANPARMIAFYETQPGNDSLRGVLFLDGHMERLRRDQWLTFKRGSKIK